MSHLSDEQLAKLTEKIHDRLNEFEVPSAMLPTRGVVRVMVEIIREYFESDAPPLNAGYAAGKTHALTASNGNVVEPPLFKPIGARRVFGETDSDEDSDYVEQASTRVDRAALSSTMRLDPEQKAADLRASLAALQDMSVEGIMPSMRFWDANRPPHLPQSNALLQRHDLNWSDVARYARLKLRGKGDEPEVIDADVSDASPPLSRREGYPPLRAGLARTLAEVDAEVDG